MIKSLKISTSSMFNGELSLAGLLGFHALRKVEKVCIRRVSLTQEDLFEALRGQLNLREVQINDVPESFDFKVLSALPASIESLDVDILDAPRVEPNLHSSLRIIGNLPNLKKLVLANCCEIDDDWGRLLPAAAQLNELKLTQFYCGEDDPLEFFEFLKAGVNTRNLEINAFDDCESLLCAISALPKLECVLLYGDFDSVFYIGSEQGLLYLGNGPIRRSLVSCSIRLTSNRTMSDSHWQSFFHEQVEPLFEKQAVGFRGLCFFPDEPSLSASGSSADERHDGSF
eukprot:CAMPEP_0174915000 /NCGR_PEP_ID=MMETSP0167-20121228/81134_1 /TAXON_ID=38298 /ORGANISM="Rhodella maculata, Strain CCMP736" /LENGTH=284 /DNA_ID=CAMNT_0016159789 /DNA_START=84 /DNA_END=938 /DNA_ORIENTATION=+